ncbi:MAG: hypothetical protein NC117_00720 [Pseudoflavonifractor sp.]|nr:hypothetical protein [Pseudoflavonifractor sp.]
MRNRVLRAIITMLAIAIAVIPATARTYRAGNIKGNVTLQQGDKWVRVKAGTNLNESSYLRLGDKSSVELEDESHKVRSWSNPGQASVKSIVEQCDHNNLSTISRIFRAVDNTRGGRGQNGAGVRSMGSAADATEAVYSALCKFMADSLRSDTTPMLRVERKKAGKDRYFLSVTNDCDSMLYFNIARLGTDGTVELVLHNPEVPDNFVIGPKATADIDCIVFTESTDRFVAVGCTRPYSDTDIEMFFVEQQTPAPIEADDNTQISLSAD